MVRVTDLDFELGLVEPTEELRNLVQTKVAPIFLRVARRLIQEDAERAAVAKAQRKLASAKQ